MEINLDEFEQVINETILKRGLSYFKKGFVEELTETAPNEYETTVAGSEDYNVQLTMKNNIITKFHCDCPYNMGPVCKHITAVIFYIQQHNLSIVNNDLPESKKSKRPKASPKPKTPSQQVKALLKEIPAGELKAFIQKNCGKDKKFRNLFLASYGHISKDQSRAFYRKQIKAILNATSGRYGFIDRSGMRSVTRSLKPILHNAEQFCLKENYQNAFFISTALMEEMVDCINYADDSDGTISYFMDESLQIIYRIIDENTSKGFNDELFEYFVSTFKKGVFKGWDWHIGAIENAFSVTETESEANILIELLNTIKGEYEQQQADALKLQIMRRFKKAEEVNQFVNSNIDNFDIRKEEIRLAFKAENYERVIELANGGIKTDKKDKPGLLSYWYEDLLRVAMFKNNKPKIIEYARLLYIRNFHVQQDHYEILKDTVSKKEWYPFLEALITDLEEKGNWSAGSLINKIYIEEKWWDRLLEYLKENCHLTSIHNFEKYLLQDYTPEIIELYEQEITKYLSHNTGRSHYKKACDYLRHMKKLGASQTVAAMVVKFKSMYNKRRALIEELDNV